MDRESGTVGGVTEDEFAEWVGRDGFDSTRAVEYQPDSAPPLHDHDFDARLLIVRGELTIAFENESLVLNAGDHCEVPAGTMHSERGSSVGAAGVLATRSPAG